MWASWLSIILIYLLQTVGVRVILSLSSKSGFLIIDDKVNKEKGTFEPNMDIRGSINQWEFKRVYNSVVKINI